MADTNDTGGTSPATTEAPAAPATIEEAMRQLAEAREAATATTAERDDARQRMAQMDEEHRTTLHQVKQQVWGEDVTKDPVTLLKKAGHDPSVVALQLYGEQDPTLDPNKPDANTVMEALKSHPEFKGLLETQQKYQKMQQQEQEQQEREQNLAAMGQAIQDFGKDHKLLTAQAEAIKPYMLGRAQDYFNRTGQHIPATQLLQQVQKELLDNVPVQAKAWAQDPEARKLALEALGVSPDAPAAGPGVPRTGDAGSSPGSVDTSKMNADELMMYQIEQAEAAAEREAKILEGK